VNGNSFQYGWKLIHWSIEEKSDLRNLRPWEASPQNTQCVWDIIEWRKEAPKQQIMEINELRDDFLKWPRKLYAAKPGTTNRRWKVIFNEGIRLGEREPTTVRTQRSLMHHVCRLSLKTRWVLNDKGLGNGSNEVDICLKNGFLRKVMDARPASNRNYVILPIFLLFFSTITRCSDGYIAADGKHTLHNGKQDWNEYQCIIWVNAPCFVLQLTAVPSSTSKERLLNVTRSPVHLTPSVKECDRNFEGIHCLVQRQGDGDPISRSFAATVPRDSIKRMLKVASRPRIGRMPKRDDEGMRMELNWVKETHSWCVGTRPDGACCFSPQTS